MAKEYVWSKQTLAKDLQIINCAAYDPIRDFRMDPTGFYVLIRAEHKAGVIEVAICDKRHTIIKVFRGKKVQDLYFAIFEYEQKHGCEWFRRKDHIAYLGKELKKAEIALSAATTYVQE